MLLSRRSVLALCPPSLCQATRASTASTASLASTGSQDPEDRGPGTPLPPGPSLARCLPCTCHGHSATCHPETGECGCGHHTTGLHCDQCSPGYYGDATTGAPDSCQPCPCPQVEAEGAGLRPGSCYAGPGRGGSTVCTECPSGRKGAQCEQCSEGSWGNPGASPPVPCRPCRCNDNADLSIAGSCSQATGECLACGGHTTGWHCHLCSPGFHGNASLGRGCSPCTCFGPGSVSGAGGRPECGQEDGQCACKEHVVGGRCDGCDPGYWNIHSATGCDPCNCDPIGSLDNECHLRTGACRCRPGVAGQRCDTCAPHHWGFGLEGCKTCDCDMAGALGSQCDELTGQCGCRDQVEGRRCQRCQENSEARQGQVGERVCEPCHPCYSLVKAEVDRHRAQLTQLGELLQIIAENPEPVGDNFEGELARVEERVTVLLEEARTAVGGNGAMKERLEELAGSLASVRRLVKEAGGLLDEAEVDSFQGSKVHRATTAEIRRAQEMLGQAQAQLQVASWG